MKKFSSYFKAMMMVSLFLLVCFILSMPQFINVPNVGAACATFSFIFWFAGVMAPDHEKYAK
jgi:hypothetical protein